MKQIKSYRVEKDGMTFYVPAYMVRWHVDNGYKAYIQEERELTKKEVDELIELVEVESDEVH